MQHYSPHLPLAIVVLESPASSANNQDTDAKTHVKSNHGRFRQPKKANKASEAQGASTAPSTSAGISTAPPNAQNTAQNATEFAGNASLHSFDSSDPLCPLQLDAHADWNADTGATSHMTPHRHWL